MSSGRYWEGKAGPEGPRHNYTALDSSPGPQEEGDDLEAPFLAAETYEWAAIPNLDVFFARVYRYWQGRGLASIFMSGLLNLMALAFTIAFSAFLLLFVNWKALRAECIVQDTCDILAAALYTQPLRDRGVVADLLILTYLAIFSLYWIWTAVHFVVELREMLETRQFYRNTLGVSERQVCTMIWAEVVHRMVLVQRTKRLCVTRDLDEHDIVGRIMRKDNYLIALINKGVLAPYLPLPRWLGCRRRCAVLTKTLEWNLRWCILDHLFDERTFRVREDFVEDPARLQRRFRRAALANLVLSPFLLVFLIIYFFMHNAERFYSHPGSLGSRRWSALAKWRLRELNELQHYMQHRLSASHAPACKYLAQFPSHTLASAARFVAFVAGSFAALLLLVTMVDETLLERPLAGRHIVWWLAALGVVLTASRALVSEDPVAYDPEAAMNELAAITHYMPRHWRGRAHTPEVQQELSSMFQFKVLLFLEEVASVLFTPFILYFIMPHAAPAVVHFVAANTVEVPGVGHICSFAAFDVQRHGNAKYGAPAHGAKHERSKQGKVEKSLLTFLASYPTWEPPASARAVLSAMNRHSLAVGGPGVVTASQGAWGLGPESLGQGSLQPAGSAGTPLGFTGSGFAAQQGLGFMIQPGFGLVAPAASGYLQAGGGAKLGPGLGFSPYAAGVGPGQGAPQVAAGVGNGHAPDLRDSRGQPDTAEGGLPSQAGLHRHGSQGRWQQGPTPTGEATSGGGRTVEDDGTMQTGAEAGVRVAGAAQEANRQARGQGGSEAVQRLGHDLLGMSPALDSGSGSGRWGTATAEAEGPGQGCGSGSGGSSLVRTQWASSSSSMTLGTGRSASTRMAAPGGDAGAAAGSVGAAGSTGAAGLFSQHDQANLQQPGQRLGGGMGSQAPGLEEETLDLLGLDLGLGLADGVVVRGEDVDTHLDLLGSGLGETTGELTGGLHRSQHQRQEHFGGAHGTEQRESTAQVTRSLGLAVVGPSEGLGGQLGQQQHQQEEPWVNGGVRSGAGDASLRDQQHLPPGAGDAAHRLAAAGPGAASLRIAPSDQGHGPGSLWQRHSSPRGPPLNEPAVEAGDAPDSAMLRSAVFGLAPPSYALGQFSGSSLVASAWHLPGSYSHFYPHPHAHAPSLGRGGYHSSGMWHSQLGQGQGPYPPLPYIGPGPGAWGGSAPQGPDALPCNETEELSRRLHRGHALMQSLYCCSEQSVRDRQAQATAARSIMHTRGSASTAASAGSGGAGAAGLGSNTLQGYVGAVGYGTQGQVWGAAAAAGAGASSAASAVAGASQQSLPRQHSGVHPSFLHPAGTHSACRHLAAQPSLEPTPFTQPTCTVSLDPGHGQRATPTPPHRSSSGDQHAAESQDGSRSGRRGAVQDAQASEETPMSLSRVASDSIGGGASGSRSGSVAARPVSRAPTSIELRETGPNALHGVGHLLDDDARSFVRRRL